MDYYLMLPEQYVRFASGENRRSIVKVRDIKNGYLKLAPLGVELQAEIALFKRSDGSAIVAVNEIVCGPICVSDSFRFLQYDNGRWSDVTKRMLPKGVPKEVTRYELPRVGTDIKMVIEDLVKQADGRFGIDSKAVATLRWNGAKFELQKIK